MKYKVSVIKKIAFLVMTMALAVAIVACQGAAGVPGEPGAPGAPGAPAATPEPVTPEPETPEPETPTDPTVDHTLDVGKTQSVSVEGAVAANVSSTAVTVTQGTPPMWEIEAMAKGTASVLFYDASLTLLETIKVKVSNQAPTVKQTALPKLPLALQELDDTAKPVDVLRSVYLVVATGTAAPTAVADTMAAQSFDGYFEDKDKDDLTFTISSAQPQYAVVAAYKKDGTEVYIDVTNSPSNVTKIYLNVSISDGTATSESVQIPVELPSQILPQTYKASQAMTSGVVKDITVQYRPGVTHMITGVGFSTDDTGTMVENFTAAVTTAYMNNIPVEAPGTGDDDILVVSVPARSSISVVAVTTANDNIFFKTSGVGTTEVTIAEYEEKEEMWKKTTKKAVTFKVIVSLSPEDPVEIE